MFHSKFGKRLPATVLVAGLSLLLTGCFITPGKFDSQLDLRSDGSFTYTYKGEIRLIGLAQLAQMENSTSYETEWNADDAVCWGPEGDAGAAAAAVDAAAAAVEAAVNADSDDVKAEGEAIEDAVIGNEEIYEGRPCAEPELAEKRAEFERELAERKERKEREAKQMQAIFGGIDPSDPAAGEKIAARLESQLGWNKVEYRGDGLFVVDVLISSNVGHGFSFPMIQGMTTATPFIYMYRLKDNTVRIDAPGFSRAMGQSSGGGSPAFMMAARGLGGGSSRDDEMLAMFEGISGTFTITTDGEILANNTALGYQKAENGRKLVWEIDTMSDDSPTALIKLGS